jgi:hypothetical protein
VGQVARRPNPAMVQRPPALETTDRTGILNGMFACGPNGFRGGVDMISVPLQSSLRGKIRRGRSPHRRPFPTPNVAPYVRDHRGL